jgi:hypothetical protein
VKFTCYAEEIKTRKVIAGSKIKSEIKKEVYVGAPLKAERERTVAAAKRRQTNPDSAELLQMSKDLRLLI